jgi:hypothetical protein
MESDALMAGKEVLAFRMSKSSGNRVQINKKTLSLIPPWPGVYIPA